MLKSANCQRVNEQFRTDFRPREREERERQREIKTETESERDSE